MPDVVIVMLTVAVTVTVTFCVMVTVSVTLCITLQFVKQYSVVEGYNIDSVDVFVSSVYKT